VYGIVKQSSGYVWVYSEPGEGSTFKIYFPQAPPDLEGEAAEPEKTLNILVIEDDDLIRSLTTTVLREQGHTVIEASDGRSALIVCHKFEGVLDLVITDVSAPGMSGEDLMGFFAVKYPKVAVVHMSGFSKVQLATSNGIPRNAYFLSKPFTMKQLLKIIQQVLENQERPRPC
jgi:DNA-binding NtrC family response regulator